MINDSFVSGSPAARINHENNDNNRLSERTTQLMSSYRDYISEVDSDLKGFTSSDYRRTASMTAGPAVCGRNSAAALTVGSNEVPFGTSDAASLIHDYSFGSVDSMGRKYSHPIFHSKKFKRSLFTGVVVTIALVGVVVGIKTQMRPRNLPNWNEELKDVLKEDGATKEQGVHWPAPSQDESLNKNGDIVSDSAAASPAEQIGSILHQKFKPLWLGVNEGWNGGSHDDAIQFCESIRGRKLCSYAVICPKGDGPDAIVMGGRHMAEFKVENEQYAPLFGSGNNWVMIGQKDGDPSTKCKTYHQLEKKHPEWGLNSDRADIKKNIMCCNYS